MSQMSSARTTAAVTTAAVTTAAVTTAALTTAALTTAALTTAAVTTARRHSTLGRDETAHMPRYSPPTGTITDGLPENPGGTILDPELRRRRADLAN